MARTSAECDNGKLRSCPLFRVAPPGQIIVRHAQAIDCGRLAELRTDLRRLTDHVLRFGKVIASRSGTAVDGLRLQQLGVQVHAEARTL